MFPSLLKGFIPTNWFVLINFWVICRVGETREVVFWRGSSFFQIKYLGNMNHKVELLEIWKRTTILLMLPWSVRMVSRWKLTRWSWLGMNTRGLCYWIEIVMHLTSWRLDFNFSSRKRQAPQLKARKSLEIGSWHCGIWNALQKPAWHIHLSGTRGKATSKNLREKGWYWILSLQLLRSFSWKDWWDQWITTKWTRKRSWERKF